MSEMNFPDKDSTRLFDELNKILSDEVSLYEQLVKILKKKQKAIITGQVNKLRECISEERISIQKIQSVTHKRKDKITSLSLSNKSLEEEPRLSAIIHVAPPQYSADYKNLRFRLKVSLNQIEKLNRENSYVLNASIEHVRNLVTLFLQADNETSSLYDPKGIVTSPDEMNKVLDFQI